MQEKDHFLSQVVSLSIVLNSVFLAIFGAFIL